MNSAIVGAIVTAIVTALGWYCVHLLTAQRDARNEKRKRMLDWSDSVVTQLRLYPEQVKAYFDNPSEISKLRTVEASCSALTWRIELLISLGANKLNMHGVNSHNLLKELSQNSTLIEDKKKPAIEDAPTNLTTDCEKQAWLTEELLNLDKKSQDDLRLAYSTVVSIASTLERGIMEQQKQWLSET